MDVKNWVVLPVKQIVNAPWNYKKTGKEVEAAKARVKQALKTRGQIVNLIVRELGIDAATNLMMYEAVNGNHRRDAFIEEGVEEAMCYNLGAKVPQHVAEMIALETNELNVAADDLKLGALLKRVAEVVPVEEMTKTLPYEIPEIESYIKQVDFSWQKFQESQENEDDDKTDPAPKNRQMIVLNLPVELCEKFKAQLARFDTDAAAIEHCVAHLTTIEIDEPPRRR